MLVLALLGVGAQLEMLGALDGLHSLRLCNWLCTTGSQQKGELATSCTSVLYGFRLFDKKIIMVDHRG